MNTCYKLEFYVPETHIEQVKVAVFSAGAGKIGNYDSCCWQSSGDGQFRPLEESKPFIGEQGRVEKVVEYKVELVCSIPLISDVIDALKSSHPYETAAYQYWEVNC